jgi:serine/threonine protein kinase
LNTKASYPILGKLLYQRYKVIQVLSAGAFAQTYIALDTSKPGHPKCVVKHLKLISKEPNSVQTVRRRLAWEAAALKALGNHQQIPQMLACFEENQEFYLVQEFIEGHSLTEELPISQHLGKRWTQNQVIQMLQEVLGILEFVHSKKIIHCDIKPNNLIRRASDNQLFLIDFGAVQQIRSYTAQRPIGIPVKMRLCGYIPPEQLTGQAHPSSDLYALGMIAIEALTGLEAPQFPVDLDTCEVIWQHQQPVSEELVFVLNQMVRYNFKDRYQSATEVLQALQHCQLLTDRLGDNPKSKIQNPKSNDSQPVITVSENQPTYIPVLTSSNSSVVLRRVGVTLAAANTLAITFGMYTLMNASASDTEADILVKAMEQYHTGDLEEAIALAESIPSNSFAHPETEATIREWRHSWKTATNQFQVVEQAFHDNRWLDVLKEADKLPATSFWQEKIKSMVQQATAKVETENYPLVQKAYERASVKDFTGALKYLKQIPQKVQVYPKIQAKIAEYEEKQHIKADYLLQQAYERASVKDFTDALNYLKQIPENTSTYAKAQAKILEYSQKQRLNAQVENQAQSNTTAEMPKNGYSPGKSQRFNVGDTLQEVPAIYIKNSSSNL